jgi:low affinity Fe/Cu permease
LLLLLLLLPAAAAGRQAVKTRLGFASVSFFVCISFLRLFGFLLSFAMLITTSLLLLALPSAFFLGLLHFEHAFTAEISCDYTKLSQAKSPRRPLRPFLP